MNVWRLTRPVFAMALDGEGNRRSGARWNAPGRGVVYTSQHLSLCVLEALVHLPSSLRMDMPTMSAVCISVPDDVAIEDVALDAPADAVPEALGVWCRNIGMQWLEKGTALVLRAPSLVVPQEYNLMLNPRHPEMAKVTIVSIQDFQIDPRLIF